MPVLGHIADARVQRVRHAARPDRAPTHPDGAGRLPAQPCQRLPQRRVAAGRGTGQAEHLAGAYPEVDRREPALQRQLFGAQHRLAGHRSHRVSCAGPTRCVCRVSCAGLVGRVRRVSCASRLVRTNCLSCASRAGCPNRLSCASRSACAGFLSCASSLSCAGRGRVGVRRHRRHQFAPRQSGHRRGEHLPGVAVDGDRVAQLVHLLEVVRDEEEGHTLVAQLPQLAEEPLDPGGVELCRRLVQDHRPGTERERAGDLHELPLLDGEFLRPGGRVDGDAVALQQRAGPRTQRLPPDPRPAGEAVEEQVLRDGQFGHHHGPLVDAGHPGAPGRGVPEGGRRFAVEAHRAGVGALHPGQYGDERGLPGAVPPDEGVCLAGPHGQPDAVEREGRPVAFDDPLGVHGGRSAGAHAVPGPVRGGHFFSSWLAHSPLSSTFFRVTRGAGSWSSIPFGSLMIFDPWSVGPGSNFLPSSAARA